MKNTNSVKIVAQLAVVSYLFGGTNAVAAPRPDLKVQIQGPVHPQVYQMGNYLVTVSNQGNKEALNSSVVIRFTPTNTSPDIFVMGDLGSHDGRCNKVGTTLQCPLNTIKAGRSTSVSFQLRLPQASQLLPINAEVTTTIVESSTANNRATLTPVLGHPSLLIQSDQNVVNSHCTGTALTSFFECEKFPSSISGHDSHFAANGDITIPGYPEYSGGWQQSADGKQLIFFYEENGNTVLNFSGWAVSANCFEGLTTFPGSPYVSPYEVCISSSN